MSRLTISLWVNIVLFSATPVAHDNFYQGLGSRTYEEKKVRIIL